MQHNAKTAAFILRPKKPQQHLDTFNCNCPGGAEESVR